MRKRFFKRYHSFRSTSSMFTIGNWGTDGEVYQDIQAPQLLGTMASPNEVCLEVHAILDLIIKHI